MIACVDFGRLALPIGFVLLEGGEKEGLFALLSALSFEKVNLLLDEGRLQRMRQKPLQ